MSDNISINSVNSEIFHEVEEYDEFYDNQINAAKKIIELFDNGKYYVQLQAQMQSGKTGTCLFTLFKMMHKYNTNGYILSGMSDIDLKKQWKNKIKEHSEDYIAGEKRNIVKKFNNLIKKLEDSIYFNNDLKNLTNLEDLRNSILIIDEIHYGAREYSQLSNVFKTLGIEDILLGKTCSKLIEYNIKIISVSATRAVEDSMYNNLAKHPEIQNVWGRVYMNPGDGYKGIIDYYNNNNIIPSLNFTEENKAKITEILMSYKPQKKYMIFRCHNKKLEYLENIFVNLKIPIIKYDQNHTDMFDETEPTEFSVVIIKGKFRLGKELNKKYICAVYETSEKTIKDDTLLQGLLGRVCGYNIKETIDIYIPKTKQEITNLVQTFDLVNRDYAKIGLNNTTFVPKRKANKIDPKHTDNLNIISSEDNEDNEEEDNSSYTFTIPETINYGASDDEDYGFYDMSKYDISVSMIQQILSHINLEDNEIYSEEQKKEINALIEDTDNLKNTSIIRYTHHSNLVPTKHPWELFSQCKSNKKQFKRFHKKPIIIIPVRKDIYDLKKHTCEVMFKLKNGNEIIEQPFINVKKGEMHTPKNDIVASNQIHSTIEDYTTSRCKDFEEDYNNLLEEIKLKINNFRSESENEKILILRHTNDKNKDINKSNISKSIEGLKTKLPKNNLIKEIKHINIPNVVIQNVTIPGKNDKNLKNTRSLYIYKEIQIILKK